MEMANIKRKSNGADLLMTWSKFDADFFNISPREAEIMDPQQRLFLQTVWKTIEDAGYTKEKLSEIKTVLFVGVSTNDYVELLQKQMKHLLTYQPEMDAVS